MLKITDAQEAAWTAYVTALKAHSQAMLDLQQKMWTQMGQTMPSTVERMDWHAQLMEAHLNALKALKASDGRPLQGPHARAAADGQSNVARHVLHDVKVTGRHQGRSAGAAVFLAASHQLRTNQLNPPCGRGGSNRGTARRIT